jgi:hypothetical protein
MTPLEPAGVTAALDRLDHDYRSSNTPLTTPEREAWRDILERLEPGELRPALAALGYERRPGPLEVLDIVQKARREGIRPAPAEVPPIARQVIDKAREELRG